MADIWATSSPAEQSKCNAAFTFALKVISIALEQQFSDADYAKIWATVKAVANNETTLNVNPAEHLRQFPDIDEPLRQSHQDGIQAAMRTDAAVAKLLLAANGMS